MKTIAVINQKGGVGKTTTTLILGEYLSKNKKVLMVDIDQQGNLTATYNKQILETKSLFDVNTIININKELDLLPAVTGLNVAEQILNEVGRESALKEALEAITANYDYCLIDCPPTLNILTINALTACNGALIPTHADKYSTQGVSQLFSTINNVKKYCNKNLKVIGLLFTRFKPRTTYSNVIAEELEPLIKECGTKIYKTRVRESIIIQEAEGVGYKILEYAPNNNAIKDYKDFLKEFSKDLKEL